MIHLVLALLPSFGPLGTLGLLSVVATTPDSGIVQTWTVEGYLAERQREYSEPVDFTRGRETLDVEAFLLKNDAPACVCACSDRLHFGYSDYRTVHDFDEDGQLIYALRTTDFGAFGGRTASAVQYRWPGTPRDCRCWLASLWGEELVDTWQSGGMKSLRWALESRASGEDHDCAASVREWPY